MIFVRRPAAALLAAFLLSAVVGPGAAWASTASASTAAPVPASTADASVRPSGGAYVVRDRLIVGLAAKRVARTRMAARAEALGTPASLSAGSSRFMIVTVPSGRDATAVETSLAAQADVRYVEFDRRVQAAYVPSDPDYGQQWGLGAVGAPAAWDVTKGSASVIVAVVDSGVDYTHPDLAGQVLTSRGYDFVNGDADAMDDFGHGTHVAGIIGAAQDNGVGGSGLAPGCKILPVKVLDRLGGGYDSDVAEGIEYAVNHGASVVNLSLGGEGDSQTLDDACSYAAAHDVTVVAAAGNDAAYMTDVYPATSPGVVAVAATDSNDQAAAFSDWGPYVDIAAPGMAIYSTLPGAGYASWSGTSMATPFVSAAVALIRSRFGDTSEQAIGRLEQSATDLGTPGRDDHFGYGLINVAAALASDDPTVPPSNEVTVVAVGGADRYETAALASRHAFPNGASTVLIATGANFPDALGAGALAGAYDAPVLLVPPKGTLPSSVAAEVARLGAARAIVLGGTGAVSDAMASQVRTALAPGRTLTRYGGANRYATARLAALAAKAQWVAGGRTFPRSAFVVSGLQYRDALLAAPLAFRTGRPVLLCTPTGVPTDTVAAIKALGVTGVTVVGPASVVSDKVVTALRAVAGVAAVTRIGTSTDAGAEGVEVGAMAETSLGMSWDNLAIATSDTFPDALAAGPMQGRVGSIVLLTPTSSLSPDVGQALAEHKSSVATVSFLGGTGAVSQTVRDAVVTALK